MRILQINKLYYPWIGGVEKHVKDLVDGIEEQVTVEVLTCQSKGKGVKENVDGVLVTRAGSMGIYWGMPVSFSFPSLLRKKAREADIIHIHSPFPLAEFSFLLFGPRNKRVVVTYHSDILRQKFLLKPYSPFLRKFLMHANKILVTSPQLLESSSFLQAVREKCEVVPLSIDSKEFESRKNTKIGFSNPLNKKIVLFVGRLVYYKGVEYLLEAMQGVDALLLIVGEGPLKEKLSMQAEQSGITKKTIFLGKLSDEELKYCYEICNVLVLPSVERTEAFGIVQLEAMLTGKPVVNTDLPTGVPFVSIHGETGITVPTRDPHALAGAMNKILSDPALAKKFGENGVKRVHEVFSKETMVKRILEIYHQL